MKSLGFLFFTSSCYFFYSSEEWSLILSESLDFYSEKLRRIHLFSWWPLNIWVCFPDKFLDLFSALFSNGNAFLSILLDLKFFGYLDFWLGGSDNYFLFTLIYKMAMHIAELNYDFCISDCIAITFLYI